MAPTNTWFTVTWFVWTLTFSRLFEYRLFSRTILRKLFLSLHEVKNKYGFVSGGPAGWDFFSSPTGRKGQYFFSSASLDWHQVFFLHCNFGHIFPSITNFHANPSDICVRKGFRCQIWLCHKKERYFSKIIRHRISFSHSKKKFAAARVNFFFVTRCAGNKPIISFGLDNTTTTD